MQLKFLIYFFLTTIDWLLIDFKDALLEWINQLISNSGGAYFPVTLLLIWGWVLQVVESELLKVLKVLPMMLKSPPQLMKLLVLEEDMKDELPESPILLTHTWHCSSVEQELLNEIFEQHLIIWILLIVGHLIHESQSWTSWTPQHWTAFREQASDGAGFEDWPSMRLTMCMPVTTNLPNQSPNDFWGADLSCNFWEGGWAWVWARTRSPKWTIGDFWALLNTSSIDVLPSEVEVILRHDRNEVSWSASPILMMALTWPYRLLRNLSMVPWLWWRYGGLTWVGSDYHDQLDLEVLEVLNDHHHIEEQTW